MWVGGLMPPTTMGCHTRGDSRSFCWRSFCFLFVPLPVGTEAAEAEAAAAAAEATAVFSSAYLAGALDQDGVLGDAVSIDLSEALGMRDAALANREAAMTFAAQMQNQALRAPRGRIAQNPEPPFRQSARRCQSEKQRAGTTAGCRHLRSRG